MFFQFPVLALLPSLIYLAAALLPAIILLRYVYRRDAVEQEPNGLLFSLLVMGGLAAFCSGVLEGVADWFLRIVVNPQSHVYVALLAFLVIAVAEEGTKLFFLRLRSWKHPAFNYRFDGVVYAAFVSLGFAALENVQYIVNYGLSVALPRALLAIPGHLSFSVFMGVYYGRAKLFANLGEPARARRSLRAGYLVAVLLHGFYDTCVMLGSKRSAAVFLIFVALTFSYAYCTLKREAATDIPLPDTTHRRDPS